MPEQQHSGNSASALSKKLEQDGDNSGK